MLNNAKLIEFGIELAINHCTENNTIKKIH